MRIGLFDLLKVIFCIMVLFVHNQIAADQFPVIHEIANCGVPGFFFISGFLFFHNVENFSLDIYLKKLRSRFKTLFVPYLFWNIAAALCSLLIVCLHQWQEFSAQSLWNQFNPWSIFVNYCNSGCPAHLVMWFVKDLIMLSILTPIIFLGSKYLKWIFLGLLFILALGVVPCKVTANISFVSYSLGAYIAITCRSNWEQILCSKWMFGSAIICLLLLGIISSVNKFDFDLKQLEYIIGTLVLFPIAHLAIRKGLKLPAILASASFFVYVIHIFQPANGITIHAFSFFLFGLVLGDSMLGQFFVCLLAPLFTYAICVLIYWILGRYTPRLRCVMSGNR